MKRYRRGATLIETLIAIFVCAIGLLALFALFPVGASSMASAVKDARCAQAAQIAFSIAKYQQLTLDPNVTPGFSPSGWPAYPSGYDGLSYPVYADPLGATTLGSSALGVMGAHPPWQPSNGIPRQSPAYASGSINYLQSFTLLDDLTFLPNGQAGLASGISSTTGIVERTGTYSWTYLLQQPTINYPSMVNLTIVVYRNRSQATLGENSYYVDFQANMNTVTIFLNQLQTTNAERPRIRPGSWILDATVQKYDPALTPNTQADPHGQFYRVVNVTDTNATDPFGTFQPALLLELQSNITRNSYTNPASGLYQQGILTVLDNVVEVFNKGPQ